MKKSQLKQIIKEEIRKVLNEGMYIGPSGNLIGFDNPPDEEKVKDSIEKIINFIEYTINLNPNKLIPMEEPRHEWKVMDLDLKDISDIIIMHGNDVFKLPPSQYTKMTLRIIDEYGDVNKIGRAHV